MRRYLVASFLYSALHILVFLVAAWFGWHWHPLFWLLVLFFFLQSFILGWILYVGERDRQRFPIYAHLVVSLRFVTGVLLLIVFMIMGVPNLYQLTLQFVAVYLSFMIFELTMVLSNLRRNSGRNL